MLDGSADAVGDEQRTIQIGRILVENALLHTPPGTTVRIRAGRENGRAVLEVEDEGPGIPATQQAQVFDRFYRVDGGVTTGSGLGLAIAKELAELMGGRSSWSPARLHGVPADAARRGLARISVENGPAGPWLQWPDAPGIRRVGLAGHRAPRRPGRDRDRNGRGLDRRHGHRDRRRAGHELGRPGLGAPPGSRKTPGRRHF